MRHLKVIESVLLVLLCGFQSTQVIAEHNSQAKEGANLKNFLIFGFLPMESPISLFKRFAPLRDYLSTALQEEVRLETAKNFPEFVLRTDNRSYDIVFTAPHMALMALDGGNYEIAATFVKPLKTVFVVHRDSQLTRVEDIGDGVLATPPEQAIVTMVGKGYLRKKGIPKVNFKTYRSHNAAYSAVLGGEAKMALVSNFIAMKAINDELALKIIEQSDPFPGIGILVAKDLPDNLKEHIKRAIWSLKELPHGKKILEKIAQPGYVEASKNEFEVLRPFVFAKVSSANQ